MYYYAILNESNVCHTILECSERRNDFTDPYVKTDSYDQKYLNSLWTGTEWQFPPSINHYWNGTEWVDTSQPQQ